MHSTLWANDVIMKLGIFKMCYLDYDVCSQKLKVHHLKCLNKGIMLC